MKHVLFPLDGTKTAEAALDALDLACDPDDSVVLLSVAKPIEATARGFRPGPIIGGSVVGPAGGTAFESAPDRPAYSETRDQSIQRQLDESRDYLESIAHDLRKKGYTVAIEPMVDDNIASAIVEYARQTKPTFIVMLRKTSGFGERFFGSVATSVVNSDVAPVLLVPEPKEK